MEFANLNGYQVPIYSKDAFSWVPSSTARINGGEAYGDYDYRNPATWGYNPDVTGTGLWGFENPNNWRIQDQSFDGRDASQDYIDTILKVGDKTGAQFRYTLQGDKWMPQFAGETDWNTNYDPANYLKGLAFVASVAAAGLGAGALGAQAGISGAPASFGGGMGGVGGTWGSAGGVAGGLEGAFGAAGLTELGSGMVPSLTSSPTIMEPSSLSNLFPGGVPDVLKNLSMQDLLKGGFTLAKLINGGGDPSMQIPRTNLTGGSGGGSGSILEDLLRAGLGAAPGIISADRNEKYADQMMGMYNNQLGRYLPLYQSLMETYTNPEKYWEGAEGQALRRVAQNKLGRQDSRTFTNDVDYQRNMQDWAAQTMGNYRSGLQTAMNSSDPRAYALAYGLGANAERNALNPIGFQMGGGTGGSILEQILKGISGGSGGNPGMDFGLEELFKIAPTIWNTGSDVFGDWGDWGTDIPNQFGSIFESGEDTFDWLGDIWG